MLDIVEDYAANLGDYTELRLHDNSGTRLMMRKGALIENATVHQRGISARCHHRGAFGFAAHPGDDRRAAETVLMQAEKNAALYQRMGGPERGPLPTTAPGTGSHDYHTNATPMRAAERMEVLREIDAYIANTYPGLVNADVSIGTLSIEKALATSSGALTYSFVPRSNLNLRFSLQGNDGIVDLHEVLGGFGEFEDHFGALDWAFAAADDLYERLREKADGTYCEAGTHDVILDSEVAGILAHEAIGHTCEGDVVLGGSAAADRIGQRVASEKVTLIDHAGRGPHERGSIAIHVDDEGTPCHDVTIIEEGVLKGFLHSKETARDLQAEPTGNARAYTYSDEPLVRMRNTAIAPGQDRLEEMIGSIDRGYYFKRSTNGQADATSEFMFGIAFGYEIENGAIKRAIRDTTISGVAFDMLHTVSAVSDAVSWSRGGMCGKKQLIPVGMGGPAIKCRIQVGGR